MAVKIQHYDVGDVWQPQATWTVGGAVTDPGQIIVRQQTPAGVESIITTASTPASLTPSSTPLARVSQGIFKLNPGVSLNASGYWFVRFEGTGAATASEDHQVIVDPSEFTSDGGLGIRALVSLSETKDWLQSQNIATGEDLDLVRVINDVSDRMHFEAGREFKAITAGSAVRLFDVELVGKREPWYVDGQWMGDLSARSRTLRIGDMASAPTLVRIFDRDWTTVLETVTAYASLPLVREPWEPIRELRFQDTVTSLSPGMRVEVTATWGFPAVPGNVRQAVLDSVAQIMDRDVEHYAQDLAPAAAGGSQNVIILGAGSSRLLSLPPAAAAVAWSYRDSWVG